MMHVAPPPPTDAPRPIARIEICRDLAQCADQWRALERPGQPFQRYDWMRAWIDTQAEARGIKPAIAILNDSRGAPIALFPFGYRRWRQVGIVEWLGAEHAGCNLPLAAPTSLADAPGQANDLLRAIAAAIGDVDLFALTNQPRVWNGAPHLFLGVGETALFDRTHERALAPPGDALITKILDKDARKKLRSKEKRLGESGPLRLWRPETKDDIARALAAFLDQRRRRFAAADIVNPFDAPGAAEFLARATGADGGQRPAIILYCLLVGDDIAAIFGGPEDGARFSGMFTSFDEAMARNSPGDILLSKLVPDLADRGVTQFDLGVGEARYKRAYCDHRIDMFETYLACTPAGTLVANALRGRAIVKREIKSRPALAAIARRLVSSGTD